MTTRKVIPAMPYKFLPDKEDGDRKRVFPGERHDEEFRIIVPGLLILNKHKVNIL